MDEKMKKCAPTKTTFFEVVLEELGWQSGFQIPVANSENKKLEQELAELTLKRLKTISTSEALQKKIEAFNEHLKYIEEEELENQKLINLYRQNYETVLSQYRLKDTEIKSYEKDIKEFIKEATDTVHRTEFQQENVTKRLKKLEKLKQETSWDMEALKAWEDDLRRKEENNEIIEKFAMQDQSKYNELEARRAGLELELARKRVMVTDFAGEIAQYEMILERMGLDVKTQLAERDDIVDRWRESVTVLRQRDETIQKLEQELITLGLQVFEEEEKSREQLKFLEDQTKSNEAITRATQRINIFLSKVKQEINNIHQSIYLLKNEVDSMRREVVVASNNLDAERKELQWLQNEIPIKQEKVFKLTEAVQKLEIKAENITKSYLTAGERFKELNKMLELEERQAEVLERNGKNLEFERQQALEETRKQRNIGKTIECEMQSLGTAMKKIRKQIKEYQEELRLHKIVIYKIEYQIDQNNWKLFKLQETGDSEQDELLQNKVYALEDKLEELTRIRNLLLVQSQKLSQDIKGVQLVIVLESKHIQEFEAKLQTILMEVTGGKKSIEQCKVELQALQVDESVLILRLNQTMKMMEQEDKTIFSLQKYRINLEQASMERLLELNTNKEVLLVKRRILNEDKGRLRGDFVERELRLQQFKSKYDVVMSTFSKNEDGTPLTVTTLKVKAAEEKYNLKVQGDLLDKKIKKTEQEIIAMENTLKVVNLTNDQFKESLAAVDECSREMKKMAELKEQAYQLNEELRKLRKIYNKEEERLRELRLAYKEKEDRRQSLYNELCTLETNYASGQNDYRNKEEKVIRTENCVKAIKLKLTMNLEKYERDFEIRNLKDGNCSAIQTLVNFQAEHKEIEPYMKKFPIMYSHCKSFKWPSPKTLSIKSSSSSWSSSDSICGKDTNRSKKQPSQASSPISKVDLTFSCGK